MNTIKKGDFLMDINGAKLEVTGAGEAQISVRPVAGGSVSRHGANGLGIYLKPYDEAKAVTLREYSRVMHEIYEEQRRKTAALVSVPEIARFNLWKTIA